MPRSMGQRAGHDSAAEEQQYALTPQTFVKTPNTSSSLFSGVSGPGHKGLQVE